MKLKPNGAGLIPAYCLALGLLQPLVAMAVGLGAAKGDPTIGETLAIEVALIEPEQFALDCFQIMPSPLGSDTQYFPQRTRLGLKKRGPDRASLTIHGAEIRQPIIEFRLTVGCGVQVARDYILLAAPSRELQPPPSQTNTILAPIVQSRGATAPAAATPAPVTQPAAGPSLEHLAKQRYPLQPKAREKFKRMVRTTNANLFAGLDDADALPVAADALQFPADLPKRRYGPYIPPVKKTPTPIAEKPALAQLEPSPEPQPEPPPPPAPPVQAPQDRLIISSGPADATSTLPATPAEAAVTEKVETSLAAQDEMAAKLVQTEASYNQLKELVLNMENRMAAIEKERERLHRENEKKADWSLFEFAIAVLLGGLFGAILMIALQRRQTRRQETKLPMFDVGGIDSMTERKRTL